MKISKLSWLVGLVAISVQGQDVTPGKGSAVVTLSPTNTIIATLSPTNTININPTNSININPTNSININPTNIINVNINPTNTVGVNSPPLYDQNITNLPASTYKFPWTAQIATITNLANNIVGETNVVILPLRLPTVKAQATGIDYISHTNQNHGFDLLVSDVPLTWPEYNATNAGTANLVQTDLVNQIHKIKLNLYSDDIFGSNHIVFTNAIFTIPATSYWYKVYRSAFTNAGGGTLCTNFVTVHFNNN